ncbi:hypothetical protein Acor_72020 [Acrocarpospora corrugata]|uniref:Uncharacterized protein n=1 Tax=Acrocarpospora corrugata TaxID=35763 RepID=A0A5M3W8F0_9ACTN|nr:hypothetical protein Acor_72020 [Acrocarpospora corrugata]
MTWLPLIIALILAIAVAVGYVVVVIGMRREDNRRHLPASAPGLSAGLARWVTGCHVRDDRLTREPSERAPARAYATPLPPVPGVGSSPVRHCAER